MTIKHKFLVGLRWVLFIPVAFIAAWITWLIVYYLNQLTLDVRSVETDSFLIKFFIESISSVAMGGVFVYAVAIVAPSNQKIITYCLTLISLLIAGFSVFPAVLKQDWWALLDVFAVSAGSGIVAYEISEGSIDINNDKLVQ